MTPFSTHPARKLFLCFVYSFFATQIYAQTDGVSIDYSVTPTREPSAILQVNSTQQGVILPRMTEAQRVAFMPPGTAKGMTVFQTDVTQGYYYWDGTQWRLLASSTGSGYIENLSVDNNFGNGQAASFDITGNGEIGGTLEVDGNVGINTTSPTSTYELDVNGDVILSGTSRTLASGNAFNISGQSGIDVIIDADNTSSNAEFVVKRNSDSGEDLFAVPENNSPYVLPYNITTGSTGAIRFRELAASGSNYVGFRAPDALGNDFMFTLPSGYGTSGELLQTNGSGGLTWAGGSSLFTSGTGLSWSGTTLNSVWTQTGNDIYNNNTGNVGIGTGTTSEKLTVAGNLSSTGYAVLPLGIRGAASGAPDVPIWAVSNAYTNWGVFYNEGAPDYIEFQTGGTVSSRISLDFGDAHFGLAGGNVGIGTAGPYERLHVNNGAILAGSASATNGSLILAGNYSGANNYLTTFGSQYSSGGTVIGYAVKPKSGGAGYASSTSINIPRAASLFDGDITFLTASTQTVAVGTDVTMTPRMTITNAGLVNIPGLTASSGVYTDGSKNLTSAAPASGILGFWTRNGNDLYPTNAADFVGVGNTDPSNFLHVTGSVADNLVRLHNTSTTFNETSIRFRAQSPTDQNTHADFGLKATGSETGYFFFKAPYNSAERMVITTAGNVGIGTPSPNSLLEIKGANAKLFISHNVGNAGTVGVQFLHGTTTNQQKVGIFSDAVGSWGRGNLHLAVNTAGDLSNVSVSDAKLTINGTTGNVGIGTTDPIQKLHVVGQIAVNDDNTRLFEGNGNAIRHQTNSGYIDIGAQNTSHAHIYSDRPSFYFNQPAYVGSGNVLLNSSAGNSYINSGNVGIGTNGPTQQLDVNGLVRIRGGSPAAGKVLTATDANGNASWQTAGSSIYSLPNTAGSVQWVKLGTLTIGQQGKSAFFRVVSNNGYNAGIYQNFEVHIRFKTSNASSTDANGFAGDASYYMTGQNAQFATSGRIKFKSTPAGTGATSYELFMYFPSYTGSDSYYVVETADGSWVHSGATGQADPGAASSSVLIPTQEFNVRAGSLAVDQDGNVGIGTTSPNAAALLEVNSTTKGFLPPRMTKAQRDAISSPPDGLIIYCSDCSPKGFRYRVNGAWLNTPTERVILTSTNPSNSVYAGNADCVDNEAKIYMSSVTLTPGKWRMTTRGTGYKYSGLSQAVILYGAPLAPFYIIHKSDGGYFGLNYVDEFTIGSTTVYTPYLFPATGCYQASLDRVYSYSITFELLSE